MSTGADLERAIAAAAKHYQAVDRCELQKQLTPRLHSGAYCAKASIDFKGWYCVMYKGAAGNVDEQRAPIYVEAKATSDGLLSFVTSGDGIKEDQLEAMRDAVTRSIRMLLVVDFVREAEVYVIDAKAIVEFAKAPWRKSIDLKWARAYGELAKVSIERGNRRVWFLDTHPHHLRDVSYYAVIAEREKAGNRFVELFPAELTPSKKLHDRMAARPKPGTPEHREYVIGLSHQGLKRAMGVAARGGWKPKRKGYSR